MSQEPDPQLEHRLAALEPPYRSKGEAQVGRMLDRYGIPFFYELPTLIYDRARYRIWHPDFTLPEQNGLIIEYAGMMDLSDYAAGIRHKRESYRANGIAAMFVYPKDLTGPSWDKGLYERISSEAGRQVQWYAPKTPSPGQNYQHPDSQI